MKFDIVTIFPRMVEAGLAEGVVVRGVGVDDVEEPLAQLARELVRRMRLDRSSLEERHLHARRLRPPHQRATAVECARPLDEGGIRLGIRLGLGINSGDTHPNSQLGVCPRNCNGIIAAEARQHRKGFPKGQILSTRARKFSERSASHFTARPVRRAAKHSAACSG